MVSNIKEDIILYDYPAGVSQIKSYHSCMGELTVVNDDIISVDYFDSCLVTKVIPIISPA